MIKDLAKGIEYHKLEHFHVIRIAPTANAILGSLLQPSAPNNPDALTGETLRTKVSKMDERPYDLKEKDGDVYTPIWISNGIFFGPNPNVRPSKPLPEKPRYSRLMGPVVQNGLNHEGLEKRIVNDPPWLVNKGKHRRSLFLLNQTDTGIDFKFTRREDGQTATSLSEEWQWVIGGGGPLIENGVVHDDLKYWTREEGGKFSATDQSYSTGPIIAEAHGIFGKTLYLIMNTQGPGTYKCDHPSSFCWTHAAKYLSEQLIKDVKHPVDGKVMNAMALDGSSARQLWIKGPGHIPIMFKDKKTGVIEEHIRLVSHFVCLWAKDTN